LEEIGTIANSNGEFTIKVPLLPGYDSLIFSYIGYSPFYWQIDFRVEK